MSKYERHNEIIEQLKTINFRLNEIVRALNTTHARIVDEPDFHPANKRQPLQAHAGMQGDQSQLHTTQPADDPA